MSIPKQYMILTPIQRIAAQLANVQKVIRQHDHYSNSHQEGLRYLYDQQRRFSQQLLNYRKITKRSQNHG